MPLAHADDELLLKQRAQGETRRHDVDGQNCDVDLPGFEIGEPNAPCAIGIHGTGQRQHLTNADIDGRRRFAEAGKQRRQDGRQRTVRRADRETPHGGLGVERLGAGDHAPHPPQDFGNGFGEFFRALRRHDAFRGSQEKRIVEQPAQPRQAVADRRRREVQPLGGASDMAFVAHGLEHHEEVEVDPAKINFVQHISEIVSLDAYRGKWNYLAAAAGPPATSEDIHQ